MHYRNSRREDQSTTVPSARKPPASRNLCPPANSVLVVNPLSAWVIRGESVARFLLSIPDVLAIAFSTMNGHLSDGLAGTRDLVVKSFEWFGNLTIFCGRVVRAVFLPPYEGWEFVHPFDELGSKSLPLLALAGAATGVVLTLSTRDSLIRFGAKSFLPAVVVFSIIKESGPIIPLEICVFRLRLFQDRNVAGGAFEKREPTHRLRMPALLTALPERAQSGLHR
jgi:Permease MlaE